MHTLLAVDAQCGVPGFASWGCSARMPPSARRAGPLSPVARCKDCLVELTACKPAPGLPVKPASAAVLAAGVPSPTLALAACNASCILLLSALQMVSCFVSLGHSVNASLTTAGFQQQPVLRPGGEPAHACAPVHLGRRPRHRRGRAHPRQGAFAAPLLTSRVCNIA
jgi:hypothetical protein